MILRGPDELEILDLSKKTRISSPGIDVVHRLVLHFAREGILVGLFEVDLFMLGVR